MWSVNPEVRQGSEAAGSGVSAATYAFGTDGEGADIFVSEVVLQGRPSRTGSSARNSPLLAQSCSYRGVQLLRTDRRAYSIGGTQVSNVKGLFLSNGQELESTEFTSPGCPSASAVIKVWKKPSVFVPCSNRLHQYLSQVPLVRHGHSDVLVGDEQCRGRRQRRTTEVPRTGCLPMKRGPWWPRRPCIGNHQWLKHRADGMLRRFLLLEDRYVIEPGRAN